MAGSGVKASFTKSNRRLDGQAFRKMAATTRMIVSEETTKAAQDGRDFAKEYIAKAGTGNTWSTPPGFLDRSGGERRMGPGGGRVESGDLMASISYLVQSGQTIQASVGWIDHQEVEAYFYAQEYGTSARGYRSGGGPIAGMHMIAATREFMRHRMDEAMEIAAERVVKEVSSGL
jgi:hypothetical protein